MPAAPEKSQGKLQRPVVCYVTARQSLGAERSVEAVLEKIRAAVKAGVDWVQIREKDLPGRALFELTRAAVQIATASGTLVFVNDRVDVALAAGATGVHLGGESLPVRDVISWLHGGNAPAEFRVGVSCHSIEDVREAEEAGADYVFFGPVFDTPAKRKFGAPQGMDKLAEACSASRIPVIAIGGVNASSGADCIPAGASGIAAIRMFQEASDAAKLREAIEQLHGAGGKR